MRNNPCLHSNPRNAKSEELDSNFQSKYIKKKTKDKYMGYKNKPLPTISEKPKIKLEDVVKKDEIYDSFQSEFHNSNRKDVLYNSMIE